MVRIDDVTAGRGNCANYVTGKDLPVCQQTGNTSYWVNGGRKYAEN
jgi:hypothetical protein